MAVICEYNPFHNGHAYQLQTQKTELGCDAVVAVMSGSFVQRGEPAVCDKWARAEMAVRCGCDLVIELPVIYSLQSAEGFAEGAVNLLRAMGVEGYLAFGSETGDLAALKQAAKSVHNEAYAAKLRQLMQSGISYPAAGAEALKLTDEGFIPQKPNDILGVAYLKAIQKTGALLKPAVIRRRGDYHATEAQGDFAGATAIRRMLADKIDPSPFMPQAAYDVFQRETAAGRAPVTAERLGLAVSYALMTTKRNALAEISGISEGLEKRLIDAAAVERDFEAIAMAAKTKRYPLTRIKRALLNCALGITQTDAMLLPSYARILGIGKQGRSVLRQLSAVTAIPLVNKCADYKPQNEAAAHMFALDCRATDMYTLLYPETKMGKNGMDFYRSPVYIK